MDLSRRQFFRLKPTQAVKLGMAEEQKAKPPTVFIRPPGALVNSDAFRAACTHCGTCAEACPFDAIQLLGPEEGRDEGTPMLQPEEHPCRWCVDMPCVAACADGALLLDDAGSTAPIARAVLDLDACLTQQGILCDDCVSVCPSRIRAIKMVSRAPVLDELLCVGCGLCALHCAAEPTAIQVVSLLGQRGNRSALE
jgi:ferredoxin-type protein NapG